MNKEGYKYYISVVVPVYNTQDYLEEAIKSVIGQSIGFEQNIQLILVNNASEDNSEKICRRYLKKYPDNIVYHKMEVNNGPCPARNAGMKLAEGKYINFLDSDDKWERTAFERACSFFDAHYDELDLVTCRIRHFEAKDEWHLLDWKFDFPEEAKIVDIREEYKYVQIHGCAAIFKREAAKNFLFDERVRHAEDTKFVNEVLLKNFKYALIRKAVFYYRTRSSGDSVLQTSRKSYSWYFDTPEYVYKYFISLCKECYGSVIRYIQSLLMYELQWRLTSKSIELLTPEELEKYRRAIWEVLQEIDDDIIYGLESIPYDYRAYAIALKRGVPSETDNTVAPKREYSLDDIAQLDTFYHFLKIDPETGLVTFEGSHLILTGMEPRGLKPVLFVGEQVIDCESSIIPHRSKLSLGDEFAYQLGFKAVFKKPENAVEICSALILGDGTVVKRQQIRCRRFFPVTTVYDNGYAVLSGCMIKWKDGLLYLIPKFSRHQKASQERRFLAEIWKKNLLGGHKAVIGRIAYRILKLLKHKKIWIVSDRMTLADDNGEALFLYLQKNPVKGVRTVFAISKDCPDYQKLKKYGRCIDAMSFRHKMLHLLSDVVVSSQAHEVTVNPFANHDDALRDLLVHQHFVFLQHGIIKDDLSSIFNRYNKNMSGFVTSAGKEYESIRYGDYSYTSEVWLTGLPRYDRLYNDAQNTILIMPTWRQHLMGSVDPKTGIWGVSKEFNESDYYKFYHGLLTSDRLLTGLEKLGYNLEFYPHPIVRQSGVDFKQDSRVKIIPEDMTYRELFATGSLLVSDYSSTVFDFAYLRKPIIYCQFDVDTFFDHHTYTKGYFDYERDGLGEVLYDLESTIDIILRYAQNGCQLEEKYKNRLESFYAYSDKNNCKRVVDKILELKE